MVPGGHRPGTGAASAGRSVYDPHPAGAFLRPLGLRAEQGRLRPHPAEAGAGEAGYDDPPPPAPGGRDRPGRGRRPPRPVLRAGSVRHVRPHGPADGLGLPAPPSAGAGGHRHPSALPQPQLHHPDRALPAAPGEGDPGRALLRLLRPAAAGGRLSAVAEKQDSEKIPENMKKTVDKPVFSVIEYTGWQARVRV